MRGVYKVVVKAVKSFGLFTLLGIILVIFPGNSFASEGTNAGENGYIEQYYKEKEEKEGNVDPKVRIVDPLIEEQIILETLKAYWEEDLKVAEILETALQDQSVKSLVLSTDKEEKIKAIELIKQNYESFDAEQQKELHYYVEKHSRGIEDPAINKYLETLDAAEKKELSGSNATITSSGYNAAAASNWAFTNYNKYSTNYPRFTGSFGTNCTNFISQAMHVGGGISKQGNWTISRKNTKYHIINIATELNYSWTLTDPSPWISVKEFSQFWRPKSTVRTATNSQYLTNPTNYQNQRVGDIVLFSKGVAGTITVPTHAMIITQRTGTDFNLAGNSVERQAHPLKTAISAYQQIDFLRPN